VGYEEEEMLEEMLEEIEVVGGYLDYPIVLRVPKTLLSQDENEVRLREFEGK
jgi:hypothetical protein